VTNLYQEIRGNKSSSDCIRYMGRSINYGQFYSEIERVARYILDNSLTVGSRVGLRLDDPLDLLTVYYSCFSIGMVPVPIPFKDRERVDGAVGASDAKLVIDSIVDLPTTSNKQFADLVPRSTKEALVIFTSGTTSSKLKGVRIANAGVSGVCEFMNSSMQIDSSIHECVAASLDHAFGFGRCHSVLKVGGKITLLRPEGALNRIFDAFESGGCNAISAPPSILSSLLRVTEGDLGTMRKNVKWVQTGAMRFAPSFRESLISSLPNASIFLHYGLSEAMRVTFFEINKFQTKLHTEGPASDGVEVTILDQDLEPVLQGREGLIALRGTNLCLGYLDDELWQSCLKDDWFVTSDTGKLDEDGFLVFCGRSDDVMNCNGVLVHPDEIESKLQRAFPELSFSVLGVPDPISIKDVVVVMCIEGQGGLTLKSVKQALASTDVSLMPQKISYIETLPRTRSGKVNRVELKRVLSR